MALRGPRHPTRDEIEEVLRLVEGGTYPGRAWVAIGFEADRWRKTVEMAHNGVQPWAGIVDEVRAAEAKCEVWMLQRANRAISGDTDGNWRPDAKTSLSLLAHRFPKRWSLGYSRQLTAFADQLEKKLTERIDEVTREKVFAIIAEIAEDPDE
jgi:hypothetical protein